MKLSKQDDMMYDNKTFETTRWANLEEAKVIFEQMLIEAQRRPLPRHDDTIERVACRMTQMRTNVSHTG